MIGTHRLKFLTMPLKGSFLGAKSFRAILKTDRNIAVSQNKVITALKELKNWVGQLKRRRKFRRRKYKAGGAFMIGELDIGIMLNIDPDYIGKSNFYYKISTLDGNCLKFC